jgi:acyl carrier protein
VAEVFRDLLGYPPPDLDAGFAELGGDSVGAARLMARLSRAHNVDIPMDLWHMAPTVAGLARLIDTYQRHGRDAAIALHEQPELDGFSLDEEILAALEIGDSHAN